MQNINLSIPDDVFCEVKSLPLKEESVNDRLQVNHPIGMFVSKEISLAKAAQLAKKSLTEFMDILESLDIPSVSYSMEMFKEDFQFADGEL